MSLYSPILLPEIRDYIFNHSVNEHAVLKKIRDENINHPEAFMQVTPEQAQLLTTLLKMMNAKKVIELGVFLGYSTIALALGIEPDGQILACEIDKYYAEKAIKYFKDANLTDVITIKIGPAIETLQNFIIDGHSGSFDFIFIDADKLNYIEYYELSLTLVRKGGIIAIDNTLWYGKVTNQEDNTEITKIIKNLNDKLSKDDRILLNMIPIGDGMSLVLKK